MTMVKMLALRRHPFGVGHREKGEQYDATPDEAKVLTALGWARELPKQTKVEAKPEPQTLETAAMTAQKKPAKKAAEQRYRTRDMKAKD